MFARNIAQELDLSFDRRQKSLLRKLRLICVIKNEGGNRIPWSCVTDRYNNERGTDAYEERAFRNT
jgi:hypothetical protein